MKLATSVIAVALHSMQIPIDSWNQGLDMISVK